MLHKTAKNVASIFSNLLHHTFFVPFTYATLAASCRIATISLGLHHLFKRMSAISEKKTLKPIMLSKYNLEIEEEDLGEAL